MTTDDVLTVDQIAEHLGVSRYTVHRLIPAELKTATYRGRVPVADYRTWLSSQVVAPGNEDGDMTTTGLPELHRFEDIAQQYGLAIRSLKIQARAGSFTHTRIGRGWFFTGPQLKAFLASREVKSKRDLALDALRENRDRAARRAAA